MKKKESLPPTRRKKIADIVTWNTLSAENQRLTRQLRTAEAGTPPAKSKAKQRRTRKIFESARRVAGIAALTYLHDRDSAAYRTIVRSACEYFEEGIKNGHAEFTIRPARPSDGFPARVITQLILGAYKGLLQKLQPVWRRKPADDKGGMARESAGSTFRLGERQEIGLRRRELHLMAKVTAISAELAEWPEEALTERGVTKAVVQRRARLRTVSEACREIIAQLSGMKPRQIKALINRAPKQDKEAKEHLRILEQRGWIGAQARSPDVAVASEPRN